MPGRRRGPPVAEFPVDDQVKAAKRFPGKVHAGQSRAGQGQVGVRPDVEAHDKQVRHAQFPAKRRHKRQFLVEGEGRRQPGNVRKFAQAVPGHGQIPRQQGGLRAPSAEFQGHVPAEGEVADAKRLGAVAAYADVYGHLRYLPYGVRVNTGRTGSPTSLDRKSPAARAVA